VVGQGGVLCVTNAAAGADVHGGVLELAHVVQEAVVGLHRDGVGRDECDRRVDLDAGLGADAVPYPAQPHLVDLDDARGGHEGGVGSRDERRVHGVHQAAIDLDRGAAQDEENGDGDQDADDGVSQRVTREDAECPAHDGEGGEPVSAGVEPVGDQRGRTDLAPDADAVERDELVAGEPDETSGDDDQRVLDGSGVGQSVQ